MTRRLLAGGVVAMLVAALAVLSAVPASAATGTYLRLAHLRVRVVHGSEQAGDVGIRWAGAQAFEGVAFGTASDYVTVPAGRDSFEIIPATGPGATVPVRLDEGAVYSAVVVERDGALDLRLTTDADGTVAAPAGGIDTGTGGTADSPDRPWALGTAVGLLGVLGLLGLVACRRATQRGR